MPCREAGSQGGGVRPRVLAAKRRDARCGSLRGSPRRGAERGRPLPSTQGGHLCAALPGCHRNEQRAVGGWGRRRVGKGEAGAWGQGAGSCSSGAVASRARARRRGPRGRSPEPGARPPPHCHHGAGDQPAPPALAWPSRGSQSPPVPSVVPSQAQVGDGDLEKSAWRAGTQRPAGWSHLVADAGPRGFGGQGPALGTALGLSAVCRRVSPPYCLPCLHHRCDSVELSHSPEAVGSMASGRLTTVLRSPRLMPDREGLGVERSALVSRPHPRGSADLWLFVTNLRLTPEPLG